MENPVDRKSQIPQYKHVKYNDVVYPPFMNPAVIDTLRKRHLLRSGPEDGDIVIATYPKCGTTWMQQIVLTLLAGGDKSMVKDPMRMSPWGERNCSVFESQPEKGGQNVDDFLKWVPNQETQMATPCRRVLKTHAPVQLAPWVGGVPDGITGSAKVVVVTRDPRDTAVSMYHHSRDVPDFGMTCGWSDFVKELFVPGLVESGCYWQWQADWWKAHTAAPDKILWITYEEMSADLHKAVTRIAEFLNIDASAKVIADTVEASTFKSMKTTFADEDAKKLATGQHIKKNHIRAGKAGAWNSLFSASELESFMQHHATQCARHGISPHLLTIDEAAL